MSRLEMEDLYEFFRDKFSGRSSPGHIDRVAPTSSAPTGDQFGDA